MAKFRIAFIAALITTLTSCEAIGAIFKTGVWVGIIIVIAVILILLAIFRKK